MYGVVLGAGLENDCLTKETSPKNYIKFVEDICNLWSYVVQFGA